MLQMSKQQRSLAGRHAIRLLLFGGDMRSDHNDFAISSGAEDAESMDSSISLSQPNKSSNSTYLSSSGVNEMQETMAGAVRSLCTTWKHIIRTCRVESSQASTSSVTSPAK
jgi:hypothetical protein